MKVFVKAFSLIILMIVIGLAGCGHSDSFKVKGSLSDGASINLRFVYYTDGVVRTGLTAATEGKFEFKGNASSPAAVEVYDNDYRLLGRFIAKNGEDITLKIDRKNIYNGSSAGNDLNKELTEFFNAYSDSLALTDSPSRNGIIARYVRSHPDSPVSYLLLTTEFDASSPEESILADSLLDAIDIEARILDLGEPFARLSSQVIPDEPIGPITYKIKGNRSATYTPQRHSLSVIAISDGTHGRDSVLEALRKLSKHQKTGRLEILDLNVDSDTIIWSRTTRTDSATWTQGWAAGALSGQSLEGLRLPGVPFFILADSAGNQLWRGREATQIVSHTIEALSNK